MNDSAYKISLDINEHGSQAVLKAKKSDTGRKIYISLRAGGIPYKIEDECYAFFTAAKPDGSILYNSCTIDNNEIIYEFTEQTCSVVGRTRCEIKLYGKDDKLITSPRFALLVDGTVYPDGMVESQDEFSALTQMVSDTLTAQALAKEAAEDAKSATNTANIAAENANEAAENANDAANVGQIAVKKVIGTDMNIVYLRDLESGMYALQGSFYYHKQSSKLIFSDPLFVTVSKKEEYSTIQVFLPSSNAVRFAKIYDDAVETTIVKLNNMESVENRVFKIDASADNEHYPTAKAVYDAISRIEPGTGTGTIIEVDGVPFTFTHGKNLIDESKSVVGETVSSNGSIVSLSTHKRTDYILLNAGNYVYSANKGVGSQFSYAIFNLEKEFISRGTSAQFTLTETSYVIICDLKERTQQLEAGTEATEYEAYYSKMRGVVIGGEDIQDKSIPIEKLGFNLAESLSIPDASITPKKLSFMRYGKNLIDESKTVVGEVPSSNGAISANASFRRTDYIYLTPGNYVYSNAEASGVTNQFRWCQYDLDKAFVKFYQTPAISITEPCYIVIGDNITSSRQMQLESGTEVTEYEPYTVIMEGVTIDVSEQVSQGHFKKKTILFDGDSITEGTGFTADEQKTIIYPALVAKALGMNFVNHAIGGSTAASKKPESGNTKQPLVLRFQDYPEDADIVYVAIGTNDWAYSYTEIGSMEDREDGTNGATPYTFYGALHTICSGLLNKYTGKAIIFATPIKRRLQESDTNPNAAVRNGKTLKEYGDIIKEVCDWYSIPVIDMYSECNITPFIDEQRNAFFMETSGGTHPNAAGQAILARRVAAGIRSIVGL